MRVFKLTESQFDDIFDDPLLSMPDEFSYSVLKGNNWSKPQEICDYCDYCGLHCIGEGTSRKVYALDDSLVLKVATDNCDQNENEVSSYRSMDDEMRSLSPTILSYDKAHMRPFWIVMERVLPATLYDFKKILGVNFKTKHCDNYSEEQSNELRSDSHRYKQYGDVSSVRGYCGFSVCDYIDYVYDHRSVEWLNKYGHKLSDKGWFQSLYRFIARGYAFPWELQILANWGLVRRNGKD
ncbi:MAG: hypothetical protein J6Y37_14705 [Paludibacteraceae bacterium]|nr:hypothetical protein [Paludibacteraceae bacterium]